MSGMYFTILWLWGPRRPTSKQHQFTAIFDKVHIKGSLMRYGHVRRKSAVAYRDRICQSLLKRCDGGESSESNVIKWNPVTESAYSHQSHTIKSAITKTALRDPSCPVRRIQNTWSNVTPLIFFCRFPETHFQFNVFCELTLLYIIFILLFFHRKTSAVMFSDDILTTHQVWCACWPIQRHLAS